MRSSKKNDHAACPVADSKDYITYPGLDEEMFNDMYFEMESKPEWEAVYFFSYICRNNNGDVFISVYIWDEDYSYESPKRYIIREGYRMTDEAEAEFSNYLRGKFECGSEPHYTSFIRLVRLVFPELHLSSEKENHPKLMLEHIYYAGHVCGAKEILYKAGLDNIAFHLDKYPSYDPNGSTPAKIIGRGITLKMLRIIESAQLAENFFTNEDTKAFVDTYRMCSDYLNSKEITKEQIRYLVLLCSGGKENFKTKFNGELYKRLGTHNGFLYFMQLLRFENLQSELKDIVDVKMPQLNDLNQVVSKMEELVDYLPKKKRVDKLIAKRTASYYLEYSCLGYTVIQPRCLVDFFNEAVSQNNCVMEYIWRYIDGDSNIAFLRRTDAPDKSFVTLDLTDNTIRQVYAKANRLPAPEVYQFLEFYSVIMGLAFDPYELIHAGLEDCGNLPYADGLREYACRFKAKKEVENLEVRLEMDIMDKQITFEEAFPELFEVA